MSNHVLILPRGARRETPDTAPSNFGGRLRGGLLCLEVAACVGLLLWLLTTRDPSTWRQMGASFVSFSPIAEQPDPKAAYGEYKLAERPALCYLGDGKAELGRFAIKLYDPASEVSVNCEFSLEGKTNCPTDGSFQEFMQHNNRFVREQVMIALRNCYLEDLEQTDLALLGRKIAARLNLALGREFVESVQVRNFLYTESVNGPKLAQRAAKRKASPPPTAPTPPLP